MVTASEFDYQVGHAGCRVVFNEGVIIPIAEKNHHGIWCLKKKFFPEPNSAPRSKSLICRRFPCQKARFVLPFHVGVAIVVLVPFVTVCIVIVSSTLSSPLDVSIASINGLTLISKGKARAVYRAIECARIRRFTLLMKK